MELRVQLWKYSRVHCAFGRISRCISVISRAAGAKVALTELQELCFHGEVQPIMNSHRATHLT